MTIGALSEEEFNNIFEKHLRPSRPVDTPELLFGREQAIERMREAYGSEAGRFSFTAIAVSARLPSRKRQPCLNPAFSDPVYVACSEATTFASLLDFIYSELVGDQTQQQKITKTAGVDLKAFHASASTEIVSGARKVNDVNTAISALKIACPTGGRRRVIVIDEFDLIGQEKERALFAGFIKQLSDQEINACFIFVGIGRSLDELLKAHESCFRYLESVPLDRLNFTGRWEIIDKCAEAISDGFPHYVHLVSQKLFWEAFRSEDSILTVGPDYYQAAVRTAVLSNRVLRETIL